MAIRGRAQEKNETQMPITKWTIKINEDETKPTFSLIHLLWPDLPRSFLTSSALPLHFLLASPSLLFSLSLHLKSLRLYFDLSPPHYMKLAKIGTKRTASRSGSSSIGFLSILGLVFNNIRRLQSRQFNIISFFFSYITVIGGIRLRHASLRVRFGANCQNSQRLLPQY